jgi:hypothetical protein
MNALKYFCILFTLLLSLEPFDINAQSIKKKIEKSYRFISETDSILISDKMYEFDKEQRLIKKQEFFFNPQNAGSVSKEINSVYNTEDSILEEYLYTYKKSGLESERYKTKYLIYSADEKKNKYIWKQYFDNTEELMKEDTLTYDSNGNLICKCDYDYRGGTSQSCDFYKFNKKKQLKSWKMYAYWTTVGRNSKAVVKKEKKQDYRYQYNKDGLPTKSYGKRYSSKFNETYTYDKSNQLIEFRQIKSKRNKLSKKSWLEKKKTIPKDSVLRRVIVSKDILIRKFENEHLILEQMFSNGTELSKTENCYLKDNLIAQVVYQKGLKIKEVRLDYDINNRLEKKESLQYINNNLISTVQSFYDYWKNIKELLVEEIQIQKDQITRKTVYEYDEKGNVIYQASFIKTKNNPNFKNDVIYTTLEYN